MTPNLVKHLGFLFSQNKNQQYCFFFIFSNLTLFFLFPCNKYVTHISLLTHMNTHKHTLLIVKVLFFTKTDMVKEDLWVMYLHLLTCVPHTSYL